MINFEAEPESLGPLTILRLPVAASKELPSRGQVSVNATVNDVEITMVIEPDGRRGHWLRLDQSLIAEAGLEVGVAAHVCLEAGAEWPEPVVPDDLAQALSDAPAEIQDRWEECTPMARGEWVRGVQR